MIILNLFLDSLCNFGFKNIGLTPGIPKRCFQHPQDVVYYINHKPHTSRKTTRGGGGKKSLIFNHFLWDVVYGQPPAGIKPTWANLAACILEGNGRTDLLNSCSDIANRNRRKTLYNFLKTEKELFESYPTQKRFFLENNGSMQFGSTTKNNLFKKRNSKIYIDYRIQLPPESRGP